MCICRDGYGASDCSYDLSVPPDVFSIDIGSGDICDRSNCNEVFVDGDGFLNTETLTCRLQQFFVSRDVNNNSFVFFLLILIFNTVCFLL